MNRVSRAVADLIRAYVPVPEHIEHAANACQFDLLSGPSWSFVPDGDITKFIYSDLYSSDRADLAYGKEEEDVLEETYTGMVGDALRSFLEELPSELYVDINTGEVTESEPEAYFEPDEDGIDENDYGERGVWCEPDWENIFRAGHDEIVSALFGTTIAREFR